MAVGANPALLASAVEQSAAGGLVGALDCVERIADRLDVRGEREFERKGANELALLRIGDGLSSGVGD